MKAAACPPCTALQAAPEGSGPWGPHRALVHAIDVAVHGWVRARGKGPIQRSATASREATEGLRAEDDHQGDQEQIVTAQQGRVTVNGPL